MLLEEVDKIVVNVGDGIVLAEAEHVELEPEIDMDVVAVVVADGF